MLLVIDIGNTNFTVGVFNKKELAATFRKMIINVFMTIETFSYQVSIYFPCYMHTE